MKHFVTLLLLLPLLLSAQTPRHWFERGKQADRHHDYHNAEHYYTQAIRFGYRPLSRAYMARATAKARQQHYEAAIMDYKQVISMDRGNAKAFSNRGRTYAQLGRHGLAVYDYNEAIRLGLRDAKIYCLRAISHAANQNTKEAFDDFRRALSINPQYAFAYYQRGLVWEEMGYPDRALTDYEWALEYDHHYEEAKESRNRLLQFSEAPHHSSNRDRRNPSRYESPRPYPEEKVRYEPEVEEQNWQRRPDLRSAPDPVTAEMEPEVEEDDFNPYRIDKDLPQTSMRQPDAIAVLIGNKNYALAEEVSYAINDARMMKKYLLEVMGFKEGNIFMLEDATTSDFQVFFGTTDNPQGKLYNSIKEGKSDVFIYYSGHGAPDLKEKKAYFLPVNCDPNYIQLGGYALETFYQNLSVLPARSKTVVLDACFSGANVYKNLSLVRIKSDPSKLNDPGLVVLASSTGDQASSWYNAKKQGMFTYFFLRAIHDRQQSDANADGMLSFQEVQDYVSDKTEGVPYYARRIHGIEQTPVLLGRNSAGILVRY